MTPEFEITTRYNEGSTWLVPSAGPPSQHGHGSQFARGWRYTLRFEVEGETHIKSRYGFSSRDAALAHAKTRAADIAIELASKPEVITFTPELP